MSGGGGNFNLQGGAIYIGSGSLIIQDSTFERNEATDEVSGLVFVLCDLCKRILSSENRLYAVCGAAGIGNLLGWCNLC